MPITSTGYDGSVSEAAWGASGAMYGASPGVFGVSDWQVTVADAASAVVSVAPGKAYGGGVVDTLDASMNITLTRPASGVRYDAVVARRNWATNTTTLAVVQGGVSRLVPPLTATATVSDQALALVSVPAASGDASTPDTLQVTDDLRVTYGATGMVRHEAGMVGPLGSRYVYAQDGQRWMVGPTGPTREWEPPTPAPPEIPLIASGTAACNFNSGFGAGVAHIVHGLPWVPTTVIFKARSTMKSGMVQVTMTTQPGGINGDFFAVNAKVRTEKGWEAYVGNLTYVDWIATRKNASALLPAEVEVETPVDPSPVGGALPPTSGGGDDEVGGDTDATQAPQIPIPDTPPLYKVATPTTTSVAGILATAAKEIGVTEYPAGSNKVKYWLAERPALNGEPWCACFTAWVYRRNGISVNAVLDSTDNNPYYTPYLEADAKRKGLWYTGTPRPGDMVIYGNSKLAYGTVIGYNSKGQKIIAKAIHVEIVEKWLPDLGKVQTIGGNTSAGTGSLNNGGCVARKQRNPASTSYPIRGYIRMPTSVPTDLQARGPFPLPSGHYFGVADAASTLDHNGVADNKQGVMQVQAEVGATVDGVFGPATEALVKKWQQAMSRTQTGRIYAEDWNWLIGQYNKPPRPTGIVATEGDKAATVVFNASNGASQYSANIYGTSTVKTAAASPITFTGLTPGEPVQITVTATNYWGASDTSARSNVVYPGEGTLRTVYVPDTSLFPVRPGTSTMPQLIGAVGTANRSDSTYSAVLAKFPTTKQLSALQQAARNVTSLLYDGATYAWPATVPSLTLEYVSDPGIAWATGSAKITFGASAAATPNLASWLTHEVVHLMQKASPIYGSDKYATGVIEGIADYCLVKLGYHTKAGQRPTGGGTNWWDGYDTTAFFFEWIEKYAPTKTPGFVRKLNQQMSSASWTPAQITAINARGRTVDQLWTEYKAWIAAGN